MANIKKAKEIEIAKTDDIAESTDEVIVEVNNPKRKVQMNDEVLIMNNTFGHLGITSFATRRTWNIREYGKKARMLVSDILDIMADQPRIFEDAWALILDEDVVEYVNLKDTYKKLVTPENMNRFFDMSDNEIEEITKDLPETLKIDMARIIKQKMSEGDRRFDSRVRMKMLQETLKFEID